jgi:alcohol dehydrogenase class IV
MEKKGGAMFATPMKLWLHAGAWSLSVVPQRFPRTILENGAIARIPAELAAAGCRKPLIVSDATLVRAGLVARLEDVLLRGGLECAVFSGVLPDPSYDICSQGLAALKAARCDSVVALGGGSVMDAAKLIRMGATHRKPIERFVGLLPCRNSGLPFICVPTTAGTGSETTSAAVITDQKKHRKRTVLDPRLTPFLAILDSELCVGLPPAITAATGIDALTHAIEAYTNTLRIASVDEDATEAVRLVFAFLPRAYREGSDREAREAMLQASFLAGRAFTRGFVGYVHAIAHRFGERYHVPHGLANAIALPPVLDFIADAAAPRLAALGCAARGEAGKPAASRGSERDEAGFFIDDVRALIAGLSIPATLESLRKADIPSMATAALREAHGTPYPVPRILGQADCEAIICSMSP